MSKSFWNAIFGPICGIPPLEGFSYKYTYSLLWYNMVYTVLISHNIVSYVNRPTINSFLPSLCYWMPYPIYVPPRYHETLKTMLGNPSLWCDKSQNRNPRTGKLETFLWIAGTSPCWLKHDKTCAAMPHAFLPAARLRIQWRQHSCPWWGVPAKAASL